MNNLLTDGVRYLIYTGSETDLIFNHDTDLPHFSLYPKLETEEGRRIIRDYALAQIATAAEHGLGAMIETSTWKANADRAAPLGYAPAELDTINRAAVDLLMDARAGAVVPVVISGNIGPRDDAYAPADQMDVDTARAYHATQVQSLAEAGVDVISGHTLAYVAEAAGMALAAKGAGQPSVISFTVETDGRLPDGTSLADAIAACDRLTGAAPAYYMINCAHPEHFEHVLDAGPWMARLKGIIANASRCSHAELDNAEELDPGNPPELGAQLGALARAHPDLQVFGGCCGTDARHMQEIAKAVGTRA